jgi:hypothetical protein
MGATPYFVPDEPDSADHMNSTISVAQTQRSRQKMDVVSALSQHNDLILAKFTDRRSEN